MHYHKIIIPTVPHPDVIVGIFLLKYFGTEKYPGIKDATLEINQELPAGETSSSLEAKGILSLDVGGGKFDHHGTNIHLSFLIAKDLGIEKDKALAKLLAYSERDDKYGLGTISTDPLDRAFGLSGLIAVLNKTIPDKEKVLGIVFPLLYAHYLEEYKRAYVLPSEFEKKLKEGKAEIFEVKQGKNKLKVAIIESDEVSMPGWLKSSIGPNVDVVCQRKSLGYANIITKQIKKINLRWVAAYLRDEEAKIKDPGAKIPLSILMKPGKINEVPQWYYDRATNSVLNGGAHPQGIAPTSISIERMKELLQESFERE